MQTQSRLFESFLLVLLVGLLFAVATATAATPPAAGKASADTNATPAQAQIPVSVFIDPGAGDVRDPFFPMSTRQKPVVPVQVTAAPTVAIAELELKGISGPAGRRLAIINNRTFEIGEEGTVLTNVGRVRVTCREIGDNSVRVLLNGLERTLTLRPR